MYQFSPLYDYGSTLAVQHVVGSFLVRYIACELGNLHLPMGEVNTVNSSDC